jgi:hypothetical protein
LKNNCIGASSLALQWGAPRRNTDATPDAYVSNVIELKSPVADDRGQVLTDGEGQPVTVISVQRTNVLAKLRILDQIADEVEDKVAQKLHLSKDLVGGAAALRPIWIHCRLQALPKNIKSKRA